MRRVFAVLTFIVSSLPSLPAFAGLEWEVQRISYTASVTDDKAEATFKFTNTGEQPAIITSIRTSCGCTTATLDKKIYEPGESGEITTVFAFGDRVGRQHKRITVRTSEPDDADEPIIKDIPLYLRVTIPQPVKVRPRMIYWRPGEELTPKTVRVTIHHDKPIRITQAQVDGELVSAELKMIEAGKVYEVVITPNPLAVTAAQTHPQQADASSDTSILPQTNAQAVVTLQAEFADGLTRTYTVMARVIRPPATQMVPSTDTLEDDSAGTTQTSRQ